MLQTEKRSFQCQHVAELARDLLGELFAAHTGSAPRALRVYREADALMLLLRFDPALAGAGADAELESQMDASLMAMFEMVTEVVSARSGCELVPGNLSVHGPTGLAVFALRVAGEEARGPRLRMAMTHGRGLLREPGVRVPG
jgi:hypothetical protein